MREMLEAIQEGGIVQEVDVFDVPQPGFEDLRSLSVAAEPGVARQLLATSAE